MPDDVNPVTPIGDEPPVLPAVPVRPITGTERAAAATAARQAALTPGSAATIGDASAHEQIEHPVVAPASVQSRSTVHDAAMHGNRIAAAIERGEASERAQQLAGAAASAGSGQAAVVNLEGAPDTESIERDPLDPVTRINEDPDRRDPHAREEQQPDGDLRP